MNKGKSTPMVNDEIHAFHSKGETIQLRRTQGSALVNNVEVASTELFDGDVIELGAARFRFNWLGHARPSDLDDSELS